MMQIFDNAISNSKSGKPQYVLLKSLDYVTCEYGESLLKHLLDGWNIAGEFINGTGYEHYVLEDEKDIWIIKNLFKIDSENINAIVIGITIYFDDLHNLRNAVGERYFTESRCMTVINHEFFAAYPDA